MRLCALYMRLVESLNQKAIYPVLIPVIMSDNARLNMRIAHPCAIA